MESVYLITKDGFGISVQISSDDLKTLVARLEVGDVVNKVETLDTSSIGEE